MTQMDWLARNAEFLSPDSISKCLLAFKDLYNSEQMTLRQAYITAKHTSNAVLTVVNLIEHTKQLQPRDDEVMSRLAILTSILEPLLVNDQNLDRAVEARIMEVLFSMLYVPEDVKLLSRTGGNQEDLKNRLPLYLKYILRCVTSCVKSPVAVMDLVKIPTSVPQVIDFLENVRDEEILANSAKIIRIVLRDDKHYE